MQTLMEVTLPKQPFRIPETLHLEGNSEHVISATILIVRSRRVLYSHPSWVFS